MEISLEEIAEILKFIATLDCASVEVTVGDVHLAVRRTGGEEVATVVAPSGAASSRPAPTLAAGSDPDPPAEAGAAVASGGARNGKPSEEWYEREARGEIAFLRSPMVGTVYRCREPGVPPFVQVGDRVSSGDVLCLVEVMKLFHSLTAETDGVVEAIFVEDGALVEFSQPLMALGTG